MLARCLLLASLWVGVVVAAPVSVVDDAGRPVTLAQPARRIVSLAPHLTETLFAAGAGAHLVGTVDHSDYPPEASTIPRVGSYAQLDLERVVALRPDLIVVWQSGNSTAHIDRLRTMGFLLYVSQPNRIEDIAGEIERLGVLADSSRVAVAAATRLREQLADLRQRYASKPKVRTFYQIWRQPLLTVGRQQIIGDVIRLCGGENVFDRLPAMAPAVTVEAVIAADPEAIVASGMGEERPDWLDDWRRWTTITAVARGNLFFVPPTLIQRHTPRLLDGAERLCRQLDVARQRRPGQ